MLWKKKVIKVSRNKTERMCVNKRETDGKENMQGAEVVKDEIYRVSHAKQQTVHKRGEEESVSRVETSVRSDFCDLR